MFLDFFPSSCLSPPSLPPSLSIFTPPLLSYISLYLLVPLSLHIVQEKMAPNILAMVQSFNQLALLVPTEVLGERTPQQRAKVISAYIQVR